VAIQWTKRLKTRREWEARARQVSRVRAWARRGGTQVDEVEEVEEVVEEEELEMVDVVRDVLAIKVRCSMHSLASVRRTAVQSCSVLAPVARGMHW
jgi:hypothetical protein